MGVDAHVTRGARQTLVFPVGYVLLRFGIDVLLGEAVVDDMDPLFGLHADATNEKVLRFHVAVYEVLGVNVLHPSQLCWW